MSQDKGEIVPAAQVPIVIPPLDVPLILDHFKKIQDLKQRLVDPKSDMVAIAGKPYILKSGWRKLAFAFNLTDEIIREEKEEKAEGEVVWRMWVKVTAPNGRYAVGVAAASTEEREFAHDDHDPYALCHTRAKNRAISDILGLGEVSAEEMRRVGATVKPPPTPKPPATTTTYTSSQIPAEPVEENVVSGSAPVQPATAPASAMMTIRFLRDMSHRIVGIAGGAFGPYKKEDIASMPEANAKSFIRNQDAVAVTASEAQPQVPEQPAPSGQWTELKAADGKVYGILNRVEGGVDVNFDPPIDLSNPAIEGMLRTFLYGRVLPTIKANVEKEGGSFTWNLVEIDGKLHAINIVGTVNEQRFRNLINPCAWAGQAAAEKKAQ